MSLSIEGGRTLTTEGLFPTDDPVWVHGECLVAERPEDARTIDARGLTVMPGFIDAHVHIAFAEPAEVLRGGVTTVRDLAWIPAEIYTLAERSLTATFAGPEILAAGPMFTVAGGYPTRAGWAPAGTGRVVDDAEDARVAVEEEATRGARVIKVALNAAVGPTLSLDVLRAIVGAAHERGLKVTGHVTGLQELVKALDAGMDEMAHMLMSHEEIPGDVIARMVAAGMTVVPTLACRFGADRAQAIDNLGRFIAAGGRVVYGTDLGNEGPRPGIDPSEIAGMTEAGMDGHTIVRAATCDAASHLELSDRGVLAPGMRADLIGVEGDPLADPMDLLEVRLVVRRGRVIREPG